MSVISISVNGRKVFPFAFFHIVLRSGWHWWVGNNKRMIQFKHTSMATFILHSVCLAVLCRTIFSIEFVHILHEFSRVKSMTKDNNHLSAFHIFRSFPFYCIERAFVIQFNGNLDEGEFFFFCDTSLHSTFDVPYPCIFGCTAISSRIKFEKRAVWKNVHFLK